MYQSLEVVTLNDGTRGEVGVLTAPDPEWADKVQEFLSHQDEIWKWQNKILLSSSLDISIYYYLLLQNEKIVSSVMSAESRGVGIRGHVWTPPQHRRRGAFARLQDVQLRHFHERGGKYLVLNTEFNSVAYNIYRVSGFKEVEPFSGHLHHLTLPETELDNSYFQSAESVVEPLSWRHWPAAARLFMGHFPGLIRSAPLKLVGRRNPEKALLEELHRASCISTDERPRVVVLRSVLTDAVVGLAAWGWHPRARDTCVVDVYCHPHFWDRAGALIDALELPDAKRIVAYVDIDSEDKARCLSDRGFRGVAEWSNFPVDLCRRPFDRLPLSAAEGSVTRGAWWLMRSIDVPISKAWRKLNDITDAPGQIPVRWPRSPMTHALRVDLRQFERLTGVAT